MSKGSTRDHAVVGCETAAAQLSKALREQRACLPHAGNGHSIRPSDPAAAQILKDEGQGQSKIMTRLRTVLRCNRRDGVPIATVTRPLYLLAAELEAEDALARSAAPLAVHRSLPAELKLETKQECAVNIAEDGLLVAPDDPTANLRYVEAVDAYLPTVQRLYDRAKLGVLHGTASPRPVYGARRETATGTMQAVR